ncbi:uncharacterized protein ACLA_031010 [Aspergillus clavatus NRRL 1]|uniref:Uncharacterized protein n=1 Tax=Aspergillus clavatus (strain ATCC 1007 / CBS 513.65 / DSM 816 / NCTC 3887 / NRRL 1 / QM 1276 / 107) TaxID=344612 RepID=A1CRU7_ASPCL|nr:uncharacterized protein ACLA_031010 [Aspergillus clavatus NRRL 1]EAW08368.1 hypothetical protein ACLA_031010 [Aspergillus clavatus NRRL 1]
MPLKTLAVAYAYVDPDPLQNESRSVRQIRTVGRSITLTGYETTPMVGPIVSAIKAL